MALSFYSAFILLLLFAISVASRNTFFCHCARYCIETEGNPCPQTAYKLYYK